MEILAHLLGDFLGLFFDDFCIVWCDFGYFFGVLFDPQLILALV